MCVHQSRSTSDFYSMQSPSGTSSESSDDSEDDDSEDDDTALPINRAGIVLDDFEDDDEEDAKGPSGGASLRTKNEIPEPSVVVPDISEVDAHEPLEKVGEIMSIIDNVVIVKGLASAVENKAAERALDSESLLVFEDRKVLGYVSSIRTRMLICQFNY